MRTRALGAALGFVFFVAWSAPAATHMVTTTADGGAGSLRQAILDANASIGADTIQFAIPGSGIHTIVCGDAMPITDGVIIDGFTQPGSSPNTLAVGNDAVHRIVIDGSAMPNATDLFHVSSTASNTTFRGLVIHDVPGTSIWIDGPNGTIIGNFIGTDPTGMIFHGNDFDGVRLSGPSGRLGGTVPADRNVVVGGGGSGGATVQVLMSFTTNGLAGLTLVTSRKSAT